VQAEQGGGARGVRSASKNVDGGHRRTESAPAIGSARSNGERGIRRATLAVVVAAAIGLAPLTAVAGAARPARHAESGAIRKVLLRAWRHSCGSRPFRYRGSRVSTVNGRYAYGEIDDNSCNYPFGWFLKRPQLRSQRWRIVGALRG
jgi:hypothetical protein